jgi:hypothetical protein
MISQAQSSCNEKGQTSDTAALHPLTIRSVQVKLSAASQAAA